MEPQAIDTEFAQLIKTNIIFWQKQTNNLQDHVLWQLDQERTNLFQAVTYGLSLPQTGSITADLVWQLFKLIERRGYWQEWLPILEKALPFAKSIERYCQLRNQLGFLYRLNRHFARAMRHHQAVIEQANEAGLLLETAVAHFYLSNVYYDNHQYDPAQTHAQTALTLFHKQGEAPPVKVAAILNILGLLDQARGQYHTAQALYERALVQWVQTNEKTYHARTLNNLGLTYTNMADYEAAMHCFDEAQSILVDTASELDVAKTTLNQGVVFYHQEQWTNAEAAFRHANSEAIRYSGDRFTQAMIANNLANALLKQGRLTEVEPYLHESLKHWQAIEAHLMEANTWCTIAELREQQEQYVDAIEICNRILPQLAGFSDNAYAKKQIQVLQDVHQRCQLKIFSM